jgi:hypothetical protein
VSGRMELELSRPLLYLRRHFRLLVVIVSVSFHHSARLRELSVLCIVGFSRSADKAARLFIVPYQSWTLKAGITSATFSVYIVSRL